MGDRASVILTQKGQSNSPCLCQHWGGEGFHDRVKEFIQNLYGKFKHHQDEARDRLEPERVFIKLVIRLGEGGYVACERKDVDDSDCGCLHVDLGLDKPTFKLIR